MENHIETNFREIQKILDSCVSHGYKTKVDALFLKHEYLTQAQLKDYLRQEIFRVTENIVAIQQKYRVVRDIVQDMDVPDFLWESGYFEDLNSNERKKYIAFRCSDFDMDAYLHEPSCYDERLPYFSIIVSLVVLSKYLYFLQEQESKYYTDSIAPQEQVLPKEKDESVETTPAKIVGKSNPFKSTLKANEIKLLTECVNEANMFTTTVSTKILTDFFNCKLDGVLKVNNTRLLAYLMMQLSCYNYIVYEWQSVIANNKLILKKIKGEPLTRTDLSSATDQAKNIYPKGYEIIDKYIKQLQKG
ncbi:MULTISPECIES: hypothetical protein [Bacteroidaceae]|uniref:Uncharacterized protein n=1 Tax=Phocaeicola vulgatus TaxID=821 RepID=A0A6I0I0G6_PHOVU|nr:MULTISPECIES: hypothetical protein [Bacteroidaceae]KAB3854763.1 hypothetical protein GAS29_13920 [Phocaeicola vulgatus]KAB3855858.1 hypothetical protein GAS17_13820 [Phocaeicola vulgatus]KAB3865379.1 hypothetical protein GAS07_14700 [Phocaeicola vulgatus]KAB3868583.1 hypothetical protein GAS14_13180 [Phocaeicola vulgatus]KAB3879015.1 hypothetical protein GAS24_13930 [Phocaeicola vulgatus]